MKTSELIGSALDWAVAKCEQPHIEPDDFMLDTWHPSTNWGQGGPIIEREKINTTHPNGLRGDNDYWVATWKFGGFEEYLGPTLLIAAMRCYVASKLGEEVEIPEELT